MDASSKSPRSRRSATSISQIVEELRTQYNMGYTPDKDSSSSGYHHLQLQVKGKEKDLSVQTRDGYYADR